jgi:hypothetical protein
VVLPYFNAIRVHSKTIKKEKEKKEDHGKNKLMPQNIL